MPPFLLSIIAVTVELAGVLMALCLVSSLAHGQWGLAAFNVGVVLFNARNVVQMQALIKKRKRP